MAIYPVHSNYVIDVDIITTTSFKAGMILMRDDNGRAIPADNALLLYLSTQRKSDKILGYAASDHDAFGNTIIVPDVIGSSYLDENRNFVRFENNEVKTVKRALPDLQDPNYNITNSTDRNVVPKRGIGVYNQPGEIYITDQFVRVLHGDFGQDFTDTIDFNPGDLLTIGSGVNAGKLVKVNVSSIGTDIIVVGVVEKYVSTSGLLHFSDVYYSVKFSNDSAVLVLDAGNIISYSGSTSTLANDLSNYNNDGTLTNGVAYSTAGGGSWSFDGTNDYIQVLHSSSLVPSDNFSVSFWINQKRVATGLEVPLGKYAGGIQGWLFVINNYTMSLDGRNGTAQGYNLAVSSTPMILNTWYHFVGIKSGTDMLIYQNGVLAGSTTWTTPGVLATSTRHLFIGQNDGGYYSNSNITDIRMYNRVLSASEILAYYNATKSRYGL